MVRWHQQSGREILEALGATGEGLTAAEAARRLREHGPNVLAEAKRRTPLGMLARQFTDFMILVLLGAAVVSGLIGDVVGHDRRGPDRGGALPGRPGRRRRAASSSRSRWRNG